MITKDVIKIVNEV